MKIIDDFKCKSQCYYNRVDTMSILKVLIKDGSSAVVFYRLFQFFKMIGMEIVGCLFLELNKLFNGCVIGRGAHFEGGFVLMHPIGVVINAGVKAGKNIVIESGVVIGAAKNGIPVEVPSLGDNIFIGTGAKVLGNIHVGNNVKIGANAVVVKDVPDGATVVGIPARVVKIDNNDQSSPKV